MSMESDAKLTKKPVADTKDDVAKVYYGFISHGDFFAHPAKAHVKEALESFPAQIPVKYNRGVTNMCVAAKPPDYGYANWEGRIVSEKNGSFRLDLQGKATIDVTKIVWLVEKPPPSCVTQHMAQWQVQFGHSGHTRLTKDAKATVDGYLTTRSGALAGVLMGINQIFTVDEYTKALKISFDSNAQGKNGYGVMVSNRAYKAPVVAARATFNAHFYCSNSPCRRTCTVRFKSEIERHKATIGIGGFVKEITVIKCGQCRVGTLEWDPSQKQDQKITMDYKG